MGPRFPRRPNRRAVRYRRETPPVQRAGRGVAGALWSRPDPLGERTRHIPFQLWWLGLVKQLPRNSTSFGQGERGRLDVDA